MARILLEPGEALVEEKKSKFIAMSAVVKDEAEANSFIASRRKLHYDARHHCSAYILSGNPLILHSSDDGEPQGTAGKPILGVLEAEGIVDVCVCVTRYFGGTLLGTGGLSRAYREAAKLCIENSLTVELRTVCETDITVSYTDYGKLERAYRDRGYIITDMVYGENVTVSADIPVEETVRFSEFIKNLTDGRGSAVISDPVSKPVVENKKK